MDTQRFDDFTRTLATTTSRRAVLRRLGTGLVGLSVAVLGQGAAQAAPDPCAVFCADQPGARGAQCRQTCKSCTTGPTGTCFDAATGSFTCQDILSNVTNCGGCGTVCGGATDCTAPVCLNGICGSVPANDGGACTVDGATGVCQGGSCQVGTSGGGFPTPGGNA